MSERKAFDEIFKINPDGTYSPKIIINLNGVTFGPGVAVASSSVSFGGVKLSEFLGRDLEVEPKGQVYFIKGYYKPDPN